MISGCQSGVKRPVIPRILSDTENVQQINGKRGERLRLYYGIQAVKGTRIAVLSATMLLLLYFSNSESIKCLVRACVWSR